MNWTLQYLKPSGIVLASVEGKFSPIDHLKLIEDLISREYWHEGILLLVDLTNLDMSSVSIAEIQTAAQNRIRFEKELGGGKVALLLASIFDISLLNRFQILAEQGVDKNMRVFLSDEKAIRWLLS